MRIRRQTPSQQSLGSPKAKPIPDNSTAQTARDNYHLILEGGRGAVSGRPRRVSGMAGHAPALQTPKTPEGFELLDLHRLSETDVALWLFRRSIQFHLGRIEAAKDVRSGDAQMAMLGIMAKMDRLGKGIVAMAPFLGLTCEDFLGRINLKLPTSWKDTLERMGAKFLEEHKAIVAKIENKISSLETSAQHHLLRASLDLALHSKANPLLFLTVVRILARHLGMTDWPQIVDFCSQERGAFELSVRDFVISRGGIVPFDEYYQFAMQGSQEGVYTGRTADHLIGPSGTSYMETASVHPDFAKLLLSHFHSEWEALGRPQRFDIVEMGAGHGHLAANIFLLLDELAVGNGSWAEFRSALHYRIVEISPRLAVLQREKLKGRVEIMVGSAITDPLPHVPVGLFFSNELVDMFPPRKILATPDGLCEVAITDAHGLLQEVLIPLRPDSRAFLDRHGITLSIGDTFYIQPGIDDWIANMTRHLGRGSILTIDYGGSREKIRSVRNEYESPVFFGIAAPGGLYTSMRWLGEIVRFDTLAEYRDSLTGLFEPKDMTLDVDMTTLEETAVRLGLKAHPLTTLSLFEETQREIDPGLKSELERATNTGIRFTNRSFGTHAVSLLRK